MDNYSVLMSVYYKDSPEELKQSIDSMLNQTVRCKQFVIVEDGPLNEELEEVIKYYEGKMPALFEVKRLEKNKGLGNALNEGLKICRNNLVARMDSDDISLPERCEKQLARFESNPQLSILGTQIKEFIRKETNIVSMRRVPCTFEEIRKFARRRSPFNHPTVMYKKNIIERLGGYPVLNRKEDLGLFIQAVNNNVYSENLDEALLLYRTNENNQKRRKTWINCKEYIQVMLGFYKKGYLGWKDLVFVVLGQISLFILPTNFTNILSKKYLREEGE